MWTLLLMVASIIVWEALDMGITYDWTNWTLGKQPSDAYTRWAFTVGPMRVYRAG